MATKKAVKDKFIGVMLFDNGKYPGDTPSNEHTNIQDILDEFNNNHLIDNDVVIGIYKRVGTYRRTSDFVKVD